MKLTPALQRAWDLMIATFQGRNDEEILKSKRALVSGVVESKQLPRETLRSHATVYVASQTDLSFPLLLGARKITLVDPVFSKPEEVVRAINLAERISGEQVQAVLSSSARFKFELDFGHGNEVVDVTCLAQKVTPDERWRRFERADPHSREWASRQNSATEGLYAPLQDVPAFKPQEPIGLLLAFSCMAACLEAQSEVLEAVTPGGCILSSYIGEGRFISIAESTLLDEIFNRCGYDHWFSAMQKEYAKSGQYEMIRIPAKEGLHAHTFVRKV